MFSTNVIFFAPGAKYIFKENPEGFRPKANQICCASWLYLIANGAIMERIIKKDVWKNIFRLIIPYRRKFAWVVTLGLLSTGASLIEPLIYREAINDVAGLFVRQAKENAQKDLGLDPGDAEDIRSLIREESADSSMEINDSAHAAAAETAATYRKEPPAVKK